MSERDIEGDGRWKSYLKKPADVFVNSPLALIQCLMKGEHQAMSAVLRMARGEPTP